MDGERLTAAMMLAGFRTRAHADVFLCAPPCRSLAMIGMAGMVAQEL
eukprot:CAMPEP_0119372902 /NCGR_PEP_ID=MMETSP1334-20130426/23029_1 /TAXON_ID=127549 /ORGANISM="Calcidiscus leptoporus, Strain RCC1130" /LENGTH=46 /DNA_ID= /DNA_START= /DNA_END= /DNA_ORIENTATION=